MTDLTDSNLTIIKYNDQSEESFPWKDLVKLDWFQNKQHFDQTTPTVVNMNIKNMNFDEVNLSYALRSLLYPLLTKIATIRAKFLFNSHLDLLKEFNKLKPNSDDEIIEVVNFIQELTGDKHLNLIAKFLLSINDKSLIKSELYQKLKAVPCNVHLLFYNQDTNEDLVWDINTNEFIKRQFNRSCRIIYIEDNIKDNIKDNFNSYFKLKYKYSDDGYNQVIRNGKVIKKSNNIITAKLSLNRYVLLNDTYSNRIYNLNTNELIYETNNHTFSAIYDDYYICYNSRERKLIIRNLEEGTDIIIPYDTKNLYSVVNKFNNNENNFINFQASNTELMFLCYDNQVAVLYSIPDLNILYSISDLTIYFNKIKHKNVYDIHINISFDNKFLILVSDEWKLFYIINWSNQTVYKQKFEYPIYSSIIDDYIFVFPSEDNEDSYQNKSLILFHIPTLTIKPCNLPSQYNNLLPTNVKLLQPKHIRKLMKQLK